MAMYYFGDGVEKDDQQAFKWLQKAAEQGHTKAQTILGGMHFTGQGGEKNNQQIISYFKLECVRRSQKGCEAYRKLDE